MKIVVLYNSAEEGGFLADDKKYADDAIETVNRIVKTLNRAGHTTKAIKITRSGMEKQLAGVKKWADVCFNLTEGVGLQLVLDVISRLEEMEIPFAGATAFGHKLTSDKTLVKKSLVANGIPTPAWKIYTEDNMNELWEKEFPVIVKAATEHGSMSIHQDSVAGNNGELKIKVVKLLEKYYGMPVLAEEYIRGREINSTVIGSFDWARVLPLSEVVFEGMYKQGTNWPIYTYEAKYNHGTADFKDAPSRLVDWLTPVEVKMIEEMSLKICRVTECFDYARTDIRFDEVNRIPYFVDLNSYPCLLDDPVDDTITVSRLAIGWGYQEMLEKIAFSGIRRYKLKRKNIYDQI